MKHGSGWRRLLAIVLSKWFIRLSKLTTPLEPKELDLLDESVVVLPFRSESQIFAQVTLFGTIIWNEHWMEGLSEHAQRVVLRHEQSHQERNSVFKGLLYGFTLWFAFGLFALTAAGVLLLSGAPAASVAYTGAIGLMAVTVFLVTVRVDETLADYHALRDLGEEEFIAGYTDLPSVSNSSILADVQRRIFYPTPQQTIKLHQLVNKIERIP